MAKRVQYFRDYARVPPRLRRAVLAVGNFDGLHLGHRAVLRVARARADKAGAPLLLTTFEPHPRRLFKTEKEPFRLTPPIARLLLAADLGVDAILAFRFTSAFAARSAESFVKEILQDCLATRAVVVGEGFRFGNRRLGNIETLQSLNIETQVVAPCRVGDKVVSSSRIRSLLRDGQAEEAAQLLGRPYTMLGRAHRGAGRGATLNMPTANLVCGRFLAPKYGVYAVRGELDGTTLDGVANFGIRPMYPRDEPLLEAHFFADLPALYGKRLAVSLISYLREEAKFDSAEQLAQQMQRDKQQAQKVLSKT